MIFFLSSFLIKNFTLQILLNLPVFIEVLAIAFLYPIHKNILNFIELAEINYLPKHPFSRNIN